MGTIPYNVNGVGSFESPYGGSAGAAGGAAAGPNYLGLANMVMGMMNKPKQQAPQAPSYSAPTVDLSNYMSKYGFNDPKYAMLGAIGPYGR